MPYEVSWYREGRVVSLRLFGVVTLDDIAQSNRAIGEHVKSGTPLVHVIADVSSVESFPTNAAQIARAITPIDNSLIGYTMAIGAHPMIRFIIALVSQIFKSRYRNVTSTEEALTFLSSIDSTLADLKTASTSKT